jgi:hypothetical protein
MGVPTLEVGYTSATNGRGDHVVHKGHVVALDNKHCRGHIVLKRIRKKIYILTDFCDFAGSWVRFGKNSLLAFV